MRCAQQPGFPETTLAAYAAGCALSLMRDGDPDRVDFERLVNLPLFNELQNITATPVDEILHRSQFLRSMMHAHNTEYGQPSVGGSSSSSSSSAGAAPAASALQIEIDLLISAAQVCACVRGSWCGARGRWRRGPGVVWRCVSRAAHARVVCTHGAPNPPTRHGVVAPHVAACNPHPRIPPQLMDIICVRFVPSGFAGAGYYTVSTSPSVIAASKPRPETVVEYGADKKPLAAGVKRQKK